MEQKQLRRILRLLRKELNNLLEERIDEVILYGSQARGDARDDSNIDVLIVLKDDFKYGAMIKKHQKLWQNYLWRMMLSFRGHLHRVNNMNKATCHS